MGSDITHANILLAKAIFKEGILPPDTLQAILKECNQKGIHLGQTLVKNRYLKMSDLVKLMRTVTDNPDSDKPQTPVGSDSGHVPASVGEVGMEIGDYQILGEIARGGMGIVYRACQRGIGRVVALKILISGNLAGAAQIRRFIREAKVIAGLSHTNIIPLYNMGEEKGHHYFTMKYVDGGSFEDVIKSEKPLKEKIAILHKICLALDHAHKHNVLHRDLKPSNILMDRDGTPYLTDFGLAKVVDSKSLLTQTGAVLGTPFYMPPEQAKGSKHEVDCRSDIYSMGVILYQTLTGALPFTSEALAELSRRIVHEEPVPPRKITPSVPADLEAICLMAMEKSPGSRYATAFSMAQDLERFCEGKKPYARKFRLKAAFARSYRRHRQRFGIGILTAALILLLVALSYGLYSYMESRERSLKEAQRKSDEACAKARELFESRRHAEAISHLQKALDEVEHYRIYLLLGHCHGELEQYEEARSAFACAQKIAPDEPEVWYETGLFHIKLGEYRQALEFLNLYLEKKTEHAAGYRQRAIVLHHLGQKDQAHEDIERANDLERRQLLDHLEEAVGYSNRGDYETALAKFDALLKEYPNYERGYIERAGLYGKQGKYHEALNDVSRAIELNPQESYLLLKGEWLYQGGYPRQAYEYLTANMPVIQGDILRQKMFLLLARSALAIEEYPRAYEYYGQALANTEPHGEDCLKIGQAALELGKWDLAESYLKKTLQDGSLPDRVKGEASFQLGRLYEQRKDDEGAIALWEDALKFQAKDEASLYLILGRAYLRKGKLAQAGEYLKKASDFFQQDASVYRDLGDCYLKLVREGEAKTEEANREYRELAVDAFTHCIALEPWKPEHYQQRGLIYSAFGEFSRAERDLFTYQKMHPEDLSSLIQIFDNMFHEGLLVNYDKFNLLSQNYASLIAHSITPDLFEDEWNQLMHKCIQENLTRQKSKKERKSWDPKEAQILIKGLVESNSPAVHEMALTGLLAMESTIQLEEMVKATLQSRAYPVATKRRLENLDRQISERVLEDLKIEFRQLLLRFYRTYDARALETIYERGNPGYSCLAALLTDDEENVMIRFLAARALRDLHTRRPYQSLEQNAAQGTLVTRLLCHVVLKREDEAALSCFREAVEIECPYAKVLAVLYMPETELDTLRRFLKASELPVRLHAAARLRKYGDLEAEAKLLQAFSFGQSGRVRAFAISTYWDFSQARETLSEDKYRELRLRSLKNLPRLEEALKDADPLVRRIAVARLAEVGGKQYSEAIAKHLSEGDPLIRFETINALARNREIELILPVLLDSQQPLPFRLAVFSGISEYKKKGENMPLALRMALPKLLDDPDPRIRMALVSMVAQIGEGSGTNIMMGYVQQRKEDYALRAGYIFGIIMSPKPEFLPYLRKAFKDQNSLVRSFATGAAIHVARKFGRCELAEIHQQLKAGPLAITKAGKLCPAALGGSILKLKASAISMRKSGAVGYIKLVNDEMEQEFEIRDGTSLSIEELYARSVGSLVKEIQKSPKFAADFLKLYNEALDLDPDNPKYLFERGVVRYARREYSQSSADIERALQLQKDNPLFKIWLVSVYFLSKEYDRALKITEADPHLFRSTPELCRLKGDILQAMGESDRAAIFFDDALLLEQK